MGSRVAMSQRAIIDYYTGIALVYCAAATALYGGTGLAVLAWVHAASFVMIGLNRWLLRHTRDVDAAAHVILAVGTLVVATLLATGGWRGTGYLWTFAYLPYAFFLASERIASLWVGILLTVDAAVAVLQSTRVIPRAYDGVQWGMFAASLTVFLLCMFLFKAANLQSERAAHDAASELASANRGLAASREELAQAQTIAAMGSWRQRDGRLSLSDGMRRLLGIPPGTKITPQALLRFFHPDDVRGVRRAIDAARHDGTPFDLDARIHRTGGEERTVRLVGTGLRDEAGALAGITGVAQDVTTLRAAEADRRRAERRQAEILNLQQMNQLKTEFLNHAAHELATPLTPLRLQLETMREGAPERQLRGIEMLERNIGRLSGIVSDLLDSAKMESKRLVLKHDDVSLERVVREAVDTYATTAQRKGIRLDVDIDRDVRIAGDGQRLGQVVDNLLSNALRFTPPGGHVEAHLTADDGHAVITVRDDGEGFPPRMQGMLFQPFTQLHDPIQHTETSSGLGLYLCQGIAMAHGGHMEGHSAGPGRGATFRLVLPLDNEA